MSTMTEVRLQRTIPAPPQRVYRAWLDPDLLRQWMTPGDLRVTRVEVDERVGGAYRIWQAGPDGDVCGCECELLELVPGERIVWRWGLFGPEGLDGAVFDTRLTVTLRGAPGGGTELTLVHERLDALFEALPHIAEEFEGGWATVLDKIGQTLSNPV